MPNADISIWQADKTDMKLAFAITFLHFFSALMDNTVDMTFSNIFIHKKEIDKITKYHLISEIVVFLRNTFPVELFNWT